MTKAINTKPKKSKKKDKGEAEEKPTEEQDDPKTLTRKAKKAVVIFL